MTQYKGKTHIGEVKKSQFQTKKHISQMSEFEKQLILNYFRKHTLHQKLMITKHLQQKIAQDEVVLIEALMRSIVETPNIIEFNQTRNEKRVVFRSSESAIVDINGSEQSVQLCLVIALETATMVTAYFNTTNDNHETINPKRYNSHMKISLPQL